MTLSYLTVWEVRSTGDDTNGGGFVTGASGTDYSQQDSAQVTYTDLVIGSSGNGNKLTSSANPFTSAHVGNYINITGGTGFTTGRYEILSVASNVATVDRNVGTTSSTGGSGKLGGAMATIATGLQQCIVGGMVCYVKASATYSISAAITPSTAGDTNGFNPIRMVGYNSTRGDAGRVTIQLSTTSINLCTWNSNAVLCGYWWENFVFDGNSQTGVNGFDLSGTSGKVGAYNCIFQNFTTKHCMLVGTGQATASYCDFTDNAFTAGAGAGPIVCTTTKGGAVMNRCYVANNTSTSIAGACYLTKGFVVFTNNVVYNNTGSGFRGVFNNGTDGAIVRNNTIHSNGNSGIDVLATVGFIENNIVTSNGSYGISLAVGVFQCVRNNAYYNNTGANVSPVNADVDGITLTGLPYVSATTDFSLNDTAGAGAACRAAGLPGTIGVSTSVGTGYQDVGAFQHLDSASTATSAYTFVS